MKQVMLMAFLCLCSVFGYSQKDKDKDKEPEICLPIKFGKIIASRIDSKTIKLIFESEEDNTIKYYNVKLSYDAKTYKTTTVVFPNGVIGNKTYTIYIKL